jgi:adenylate kinase
VAVIIAITGTPGTGKSSTCEVLSRRGYAVLDLDEIARREGYIVGRDELRGSDEVDLDALREGLRVPAKVAFLKGHYSHQMDVNMAIVLRCRPSVLRARLETRGWSPAKVRENVESEAIDGILQEAVGRLPFVFEIDTTDATPSETAEVILAILQGETKGHEPGSVDWTSEVLSWY